MVAPVLLLKVPGAGFCGKTTGGTKGATGGAMGAGFEMIGGAVLVDNGEMGPVVKLVVRGKTGVGARPCTGAGARPVTGLDVNPETGLGANPLMVGLPCVVVV